MLSCARTTSRGAIDEKERLDISEGNMEGLQDMFVDVQIVILWHLFKHRQSLFEYQLNMTVIQKQQLIGPAKVI